ncbi:MAG: STAS domain-containing protein [bacterium]|nr:STAS domain-containing protein [bacterium]
MQITIDDNGPFAIVRVTGHLSGEDARRLTEEVHPLMRGRETRLAVGLEELKTVDSAGLSCLIGIVTRARLGQGQAVLVGPSKFVRGVLEVTQLDTWFDICADFDEAAERLS